MIFCNSGPIAASCYLQKDVVTDALDAFIRGTLDLIILSTFLIFRQRHEHRFRILQDFSGP